MKNEDGIALFSHSHEAEYRKRTPWYKRIWHRIKAIFVRPKFSASALERVYVVDPKMFEELKFKVDIPPCPCDVCTGRIFLNAYKTVYTDGRYEMGVDTALLGDETRVVCLHCFECGDAKFGEEHNCKK